MKHSFTTLIVLLGAIALTQRAYANEVNVPAHESTPGKAAALETKPATINHNSNTTDEISRLNQVTNSIPAVHNQPSLSVSPFDFLKNPSGTIKHFLDEKPNQTQQPIVIDPLAVPKPPLDNSNRGSINVTVSHF
jgi:hypothetical protein